MRDWWEVEGRVRVWYNVGVRVFVSGLHIFICAVRGGDGYHGI